MQQVYKWWIIVLGLSIKMGFVWSKTMNKFDLWLKFNFISQYFEQKDSTYPSLKWKKESIYHFITTLFGAKYPILPLHK